MASLLTEDDFKPQAGSLLSEEDFTDVPRSLLTADDFEPAPAPAPLVREPAKFENEKPWGIMDNIAAAGAGLELGFAGQAVPFASTAITSPVEAAPRPNMLAKTLGIPEAAGNLIQAAPGFPARIAETALGAVFGGKPGAAVAAGASTLGLNAEQRRIGMERERDALAAAQGTMTPYPETKGSEFAESWKQTDVGDVVEAGVNAALTPVAMAFGTKMDSTALTAIATGARPLIAQGASMIKQAGFDGVTAIPAAITARANAENMTAEDWLNPEKVAKVLDPVELLKEARNQVAFSAGGQLPGALATNAKVKEWQEPVVTPARAAELQGDLEMETQARADLANDLVQERGIKRGNAAAREEIATTEQKALQTRELLQQEQIATEDAIARQAVVEAERAFKDNPTPENQQARVAAIERVESLSAPTETPVLALPAPEGRTAFSDGAKMLPDEPQVYTEPKAPGEPVSDIEALGYVPKNTLAVTPGSEMVIKSEGTPAQVAALKKRLAAETEPQVYVVNGERIETAGHIANKPVPIPESDPSTGALYYPDGAPAARRVGLGIQGRVRNIDMQAQPKADPVTQAYTTPNEGLVGGLRRIGNRRQTVNLETAAVSMPKREGGINLNRFAKDDIATQELIAGAQMTNEETVAAMRLVEGGVLDRASKIDKWKDPKKVEAIKANEVLSDEEGIALDNYTMGRVSEFRDNPTPENLQTMQKYLAASAGVASAQGRALSSRNVSRKMVYAQAPSWERAMINTRDMFKSGGVETMPADAIKRLSEVKNKDSDSEIMDALMDIKRTHAGKMGQLSSYRYINMLSSPTTHLGNAESNAATLIDIIAGRPMAHVLDKVAPGKSVLARGETRAGITGAYKGAGDAVKKGWFVLQKGYRIGDIADMDPEKLPVELFGKSKNPMNYVTRAMFAADEVFKGVADSFYRTGISYRKAYKEGIESGLEGDALKAHVADKLETYMWGDMEIDKQAKEFSKYMVHQEPSKLSSISSGPGAVEMDKTIIDTGISLVQPFFKTIINAFTKQANTAGLGYLAPMRKNLTREQKLQRVSSAMTGSMTALALYTFANSGDIEITTDVPKDAGERENFYESGKKPYHLTFGKHGSIDYRFLGPYALVVLGIGELTEAQKKQQENPEKEISIPTETLAGIGKALAALPVFSGVGGLMEVLTDPERSFAQYAANLTSQIIPLSSLQRFTNRQGITGDEVPDAKTWWDRVLSGTVADVTLPRKLNSFGQPVTRNKEEGDPVYLEFSRLGLKPPSVPTRARVGKETKTLTPEQKRELLASGADAYEDVLSYIQSPAYKAMSDKRKKERLEKKKDKEIEQERKPGLRRLRHLRSSGTE